jgi:glutamyl-tRNA reductase
VKLVLLGMNHRTAPLDVRERLAVEDPQPVLQKLARSDEVDEAVLLSTCNRIEIVVLTRDVDAARLRLRSFFRRELSDSAYDVGEAALDRALYEHRDSDAMRHVLRVASALDSMVVGEPQILGQTKDAYRSPSSTASISAPSRRPSACAPRRASPSGRSPWPASP